LGFLKGGEKSRKSECLPLVSGRFRICTLGITDSWVKNSVQVYFSYIGEFPFLEL
jgi:hypothetical protein